MTRPFTRHQMNARVLAACLAGGVLCINAVGLASAAEPEVKIVDFAYDPGSITVHEGQAVRWTDTSATQHTVTADDGSFDSGRLSKNDAFANVFDAPGTFAYHCTIHPNQMRGLVTVLAAEPTPTLKGTPTATPPPGTLPPNFRTPVLPPSQGSNVEPTDSASAMPASGGTTGSSGGDAFLLIAAGLVIVAIVALASRALGRRSDTG